MRELLLAEGERLIGFNACISNDDPYELHDIRWMIAKIREIPKVEMLASNAHLAVKA